MSKRKATTDIHPNAVEDGTPSSRRYKIGYTYENAPAENTNKTLALSSTPKMSTGSSNSKGLFNLASGSMGISPAVASGIRTSTPVTDTSKPGPSNDVDLVDSKIATQGQISESGAPKGDTLPESEWDIDPTTMRSKYFMKNMADLNRSFAHWINSCIDDDPTAILTRVFIDHQRHAQALFDEERDHTIDLDRLLVLRAQEKVLQQLKEISDDDSSCSDNTESNISTPVVNGNVSADELSVTKHPSFALSPISIAPKETTTVVSSSFSMATKNTPLVVSSPISMDPKEEINPFLRNTSTNGIIPPIPTANTTESGKGNFKFLGPTSTLTTAEKSVNFSSFSFASACNEAAVKAAAAKEQQEEETNEDEPPKVVFTAVQEDGAVYTKRCKIFFKKLKEEGYEDRGVGNLFVKPVPSTNRHQLIVRSETSLGNLLVNVLLSPDIPVKKMGDKNVMLVLVPTPGSAVRIVMVRVKDGADDLVESLTKFSKIE